jgi:alpha-tubulin suppressor-like RCC1 family protein
MRSAKIEILKETHRTKEAEDRDDLQTLERKYQQAVRTKDSARTAEEYVRARRMFEELGNYRDAVELNRYCEAVGEEIGSLRREPATAEKEPEKPVRWKPERFEQQKIWRTMMISSVAALLLSIAVLWYYGTHRWTDMVQISCGHRHTIGVRADGTVKAVGFNRYGQCAVYNWENIVQVSAGEYHSVGLQSDGTVVAIGSNKYGQCDVSEWTDIVAVSACEYYTLGLKADGTVVATGLNSNHQCEVEDLRNITQICASRRMTLALNHRGQITGVTQSVHDQYAENWPEVTKISANKFNFMGLRPDGTVICTGSDLYGQLAVSEWEDIVDISSGYEHSVGLKSDGTVVAAGFNNYGECDVENWTGIVAVAAGNRITIGIKADGTVVAAGDYKYGGLLAVWARTE